MIALSHGWKIKFILPGHESPMANHNGGEIAVDDDQRIMYGWHVFAVLYGTESIVKACEQYIAQAPTTGE